jgi:phosphopantetheinyl transferase
VTPLAAAWPLSDALRRAGVQACTRAVCGGGGGADSPDLSGREREALARLPGPPRRRYEWTAGRLAAKDAVRLFAARRRGLELQPEAIEVLSDEHGRPVVCGDAAAAVGCPLDVSIAHSGDRAAAACCDGSRVAGIGVDIENIDGNHDGLTDLAFAAGELALLEQIPAPQRAEWLIRMWCAKEAVAKACGTGMAGGPWNLEIRGMDAASGEIVVAPIRALAAVLAADRRAPLAARTGRDGGAAWALAVA